MTVVNLSFAACGFLGIYHLGAVGAFLRHGDKLLTSLKSCAGSSAGALVAAVMLTAPEKVKHCKEFTYDFAENVRQQRFGAITPGFNVLSKLREGIEEMLPVDAHILASDRLHVSLTHFRSGKNLIVCQFNSREELIQALLASSFVPVYSGLQPVVFRGQKWIDGGFTDSLPILPVGRTITVSPFAGQQDVSPLHKGHGFKTQLRLTNMNILAMGFGLLACMAEQEGVMKQMLLAGGLLVLLTGCSRTLYLQEKSKSCRLVKVSWDQVNTQHRVTAIVYVFPTPADLKVNFQL